MRRGYKWRLFVDAFIGGAIVRLCFFVAGKIFRNVFQFICQAKKQDLRPDLRVAVTLAQAVLRTDGIGAFGEAVEVVKGYVEQYWEPVYPRLDPDDDNELQQREQPADLVRHVWTQLHEPARHRTDG